MSFVWNVARWWLCDKFSEATPEGINVIDAWASTRSNCRCRSRLTKPTTVSTTTTTTNKQQSLTSFICRWIINMEGVPGTLYEGEHFQLQFKFTNKYPFDSPEVTFIGNNIPIHPHVYSNGHICLSILTDDWSPALSVQSVCLSIVSMLSSCKEKVKQQLSLHYRNLNFDLFQKRPPDNSFYVKTCNKNPKKTKWWYHGKQPLLSLFIFITLQFLLTLWKAHISYTFE